MKAFITIFSCIGLVFVAALIFAADSTNVELKVKTRYDVTGTPVNQAQNAKGYHVVVGSAKLVSGRTRLSLNTSTVNGKQDVSFISNKSFGGFAWSLDSSNTNTYRVVPLSGTLAVIMSSSGSDTATVYFSLEGE